MIREKIREIHENEWEIISSKIQIIDNLNIYINSQYPSNFNTTNNRKLYSCGICCPDLQSKFWFTNCKSDYNIACIHLKKVFIALDPRSNYNNEDNLFLNILNDENEKQIIKLLKMQLENPNKRQIYFPDSFENLSSLMPDPQLYDCINYCKKVKEKFTIFKNYRIYSCSCNKYLNSNNSECIHIQTVKAKEEKNHKIINLGLLISRKYFEIIKESN